jgi:hypothetical protein
MWQAREGLERAETMPTVRVDQSLKITQITKESRPSKTSPTFKNE